MCTNSPCRHHFLTTHPYRASAVRSIRHSGKLAYTALLALLIGFSGLHLFGQDPQEMRQGTETSLSVASAAESAATTSEAKPGITATARVRSSGRPVSPGTVLFCDADAPFCLDGAVVGKAQLASDGTAVLHLSPGTLARHHNLRAIFVGTNTHSTSVSGVSPFTVPDPPYPSTTLLAASGTPSNYTLTATVQGGAYSDASIPPGQVSIVDTTSSQTLGMLTLNAGKEVVTYAARFDAGATDASPVAMVLADFNGDGLTDVATANAGAHDVTVLLYDGGGGFNAVSPALTPGSKPT